MYFVCTHAHAHTVYLNRHQCHVQSLELGQGDSTLLLLGGWGGGGGVLVRSSSSEFSYEMFKL